MAARYIDPSPETRGTPQPRDPFDRKPAMHLDVRAADRIFGRSKASTRDLPRELRNLRPLTTYEAALLSGVGQFRTVAADDLTREAGNRHDYSLRVMKELGLLRSHWLPVPETRSANKKAHTSHNSRQPAVASKILHVVTVTRKGAAWLRANGYDERASGRLQTGLTKPREAFHDARLYALAQTAQASLRASRCTPVATHTDYVLKSRLQSETHRLLRTGMQTQAAQMAAAELFAIPVIDGKAVLPDLRIEYDREDGQRTYSDLELLSDSYSKGAVATKAAAGFASYTANCNGTFTPKGGGSPWDPDHMARFMR